MNHMSKSIENNEMTTTADDSQSWATEQTADARFIATLAQYLFFTSLVFLTSVGSLCNLMTLFVCLRRNIRVHSWGIYIAALSVADISNMATLAFCFNVAHRSCYFLFGYVRGLSHWVLLVIAVDRLLVVFRPFKAHMYSSRKRAVLVTLAIYLSLFGLNAPGLIGIKQTEMGIYLLSNFF